MSTNAVSTVFSPITFAVSGKTAPNRILKSAMTERACTWDDNNWDECGKPTPEYLRLYEEWGKGGTGIIVLGNIPCDRHYPEAKRNAVIDPDSPWDTLAAFKPVIAATKAHGAICIAQVTHAGRQTADDIASEPISSSDVQSAPLGGMTFAKPRAATIDEVHDIVRRFAYAAKVLYDAGADGIQLHAAHGYLLSQFLSPRVNKRTDQYGGSLENRQRIVFEIIDAIKAAVQDDKFILSIKINSADFSDGGFSEEESKITVQRLEGAGVDLIELSGGTYESMALAHQKESTKRREAFFIEFAERFRPHLKSAKLAVTGGFRSLDGMAQAISSDACDIVGVARPLTAEFNLPALLSSGKSHAARTNLVDESVQIAASYYLLGQAMHGEPLADLSDEKTARALEDAIKSAPRHAFQFRAEIKS